MPVAMRRPTTLTTAPATGLPSWSLTKLTMDPPVAGRSIVRTGLRGAGEDSPPEARTGVLPPTPTTAAVTTSLERMFIARTRPDARPRHRPSMAGAPWFPSLLHRRRRDGERHVARQRLARHLVHHLDLQMVVALREAGERHLQAAGQRLRAGAEIQRRRKRARAQLFGLGAIEELLALGQLPAEVEVYRHVGLLRRRVHLLPVNPEEHVQVVLFRELVRDRRRQLDLPERVRVLRLVVVRQRRREHVHFLGDDDAARRQLVPV